MPTTILITGANRGIGRGLLEAYVLKPNTTVIAGVRDVASSEKSLSSVKLGTGSKIITVKLDSADKTGAKVAVEELTTEHDDVVIANAGIAKYWGTVLDSPSEEFVEHYNATWSLLDRVASPKFVVITSFLGSITGIDNFPIPDAAYASSKAAINFIARKLHFEHEKLLVVTINPGWVQTDMGNAGAAANGLAEAPVTLQESVTGIVSKVDDVTPATSGSFSYDETESSW
ncbi:aflatoxin biosynthesis ketoreductase nor-1-like protein [Lipomyces mesembrius]